MFLCNYFLLLLLLICLQKMGLRLMWSMCLWSNGCTECGLSLLLPKMCIRSWLKSWNERKTSTWKCETWNEKTSSSKLDLEESKNAAIDKTTGKNQAKSTSGGWKSRRSSISRLPCSFSVVKKPCASIIPFLLLLCLFHFLSTMLLLFLSNLD